VTRVVLFTGKGGVGKTTCAAASAAFAARRGARVLVTSTDPAHSLADAFDTPVGDRPTPVADGVDAQQIDAQTRLEAHWREIRDYLVQLLAWGGLGEVQAQELVLVPGFDELFALLDLQEQVRAGAYDLVVVDCAPTAETLRLLALPDALQWYAEKLVQPGRRVARAVRPLATRVGGVPVPEDGVFGAVDRLQQRLAAVHAPRPRCPCSGTASTRSSPTGCCPTRSTTRSWPAGANATPSTWRRSGRASHPPRC
jgi:arsenite-transporting ATPase